MRWNAVSGDEEGKDMRNLILCGFMGCGKSTCAACLCRMTGAEQIEIVWKYEEIYLEMTGGSSI